MYLHILLPQEIKINYFKQLQGEPLTNIVLMWLKKTLVFESTPTFLIKEKSTLFL